MCGIAGLLNFTGEPVDPGLTRRMIARLRHRGPDGVGFHSEANVGLAHARLSILDLCGGQQPMHNEDESLWITFNGEIYNYVELREDLIRKGHRFATRSDTEVILHLYEELGEDCVHEFNGQWAFAIWNREARTLFLSRDRLGVRPLFYRVTPESFAFASEIKSILAVPGVERELDPIALDQIFTFWFSIPPRTIFKQIQELRPGHSLTVERGGVTQKRYWEPRFDPQDNGRYSEDAYADKLRELLADATRLRLRSDVPVGAYLSGGLDSTMVTALIRRCTDVHLKTFSIAFDDPEFDERGYQQEAARFLQTDHQEVRCTNADIGRIFPEMIWHTEKPVLRTAPAPLFLLSKLVRDRNYKVVLTGEGSDEILGGYDIFKEAKIRRFWSARPDSRLRPLLLKRLYPYLPNLQDQPTAYLQAFFHVGANNVADPFFSHLPRWDLTSRLKRFFSEAVRAETQCYDGYAELRSLLPAGFADWDPFCQAQFLETGYLLPGYILSSQGDRVAMAHSVEGRFPFLDHRVVDFAAGVAPSLKMKVLNEKHLLKLCARDLVPLSVRKRSKQPYRAPDGKSFFHDARPDYVDELLSPARIRADGLFHPGAVERLTQKFRDGRAIGVKDNMALTGILSTQLIVHQFVRHFGERSADD
jgi:asparagine synthase (glutamine-hydrolysing)